MVPHGKAHTQPFTVDEAAYLELPVGGEVRAPVEAGVELHPVARDPGDLLAAPELWVTQQSCPLIDIMPSPLQSASTWKKKIFVVEIFSMKGHW